MRVLVRGKDSELCPTGVAKGEEEGAGFPGISMTSFDNSTPRFSFLIEALGQRERDMYYY